MLKCDVYSDNPDMMGIFSIIVIEKLHMTPCMAVFFYTSRDQWVVCIIPNKYSITYIQMEDQLHVANRKYTWKPQKHEKVVPQNI